MLASEKRLAVQPIDRTVRAAGVLYLVLVVTGIFSFFVPQALSVEGNPSATAQKILASETLFRLAIAVGLAASIVFVFLARELYRLLKGISRTQATLMVVLALLSVPISFLGAVDQIAALRLFHGGAGLAGLQGSQLNTLAMFFLDLGSDTAAVNSIFFGLWLLPFGLLVIRSGFIPRLFGYLLLIAGGSHIVGRFNYPLSPPLAPVISGVATFGYLGELGVVGWLVVQAARVQLGRSLNIKQDESVGGVTW